VAFASRLGLYLILHMDTEFTQVASSFTCTPVEPSLRRSLDSLGVPAELRFAMYAQMNQALLSPDTKSTGTIVLLRVEDWLRDAFKSEPVVASGGAAPAVREALRARTDEFVQQISALSQNGKPVWFLACPSTGWISGRHKLETVCQTYTNLLLARVRNIPQVTTLQWPGSLSQAEFQDRSADRLGQIPFTQEAFNKLGEFLGQQLAKTSKPNIQNALPGAGSTQLSEYLKSLKVEVSLVPAQAGDRAHIDRLLRNAASFSLTGEQRDLSEANIDAYLADGHCLLVKVSDRIADYGETALVAFRTENDTLLVHAFAVSCAVLGKQVEYATVAALTQLATEHGLAKLLFEYRPSERNQAMQTFLQSLTDPGFGTSYVLPVATFEAKLKAAATAPGAWTVKFGEKLSASTLTGSVR